MAWFSMVFIDVSVAQETAESVLPDAESWVYRRVEGTELRLWVYRPELGEESETRPAAIFFFGGGWVGGSPTQFAPHARYLASRGMVGVVADYRVRSRHNTTPFDALEDCREAIRWLRRNAPALGIDPARIAAGGGSAGGHLAAATGMIPGPQDEDISSKPDALVLFNPVYDNGPGGYGHDRVKDRYLEISPLHNIRAGAPPTLTMLGTKDSLVPVATAERFQQAMEAVGARSETRLFPERPHGFFNPTWSRRASNPRDFYETVTFMDRFLVSLGYLNGEPTMSAPQFHIDDSHPDYMEILFGGRRIARYRTAYDASTEERRHETYKPYLGVYDESGQLLITKEHGGQFTHHRGIFLGFNRLSGPDGRWDLWHMTGGVQRHIGFKEIRLDSERAVLVARIAWETKEGDRLIDEERTWVIEKPDADFLTKISMVSELKAVASSLVFSGDPEHAGAQFRCGSEIDRSKTKYFFETTDTNPRENFDLSWAGLSAEIGGTSYTIYQLNHENNPQGTRFSAYRDYGRFGAFPSFEVEQGEARILRYQWLVRKGVPVSNARLNEALELWNQN